MVNIAIVGAGGIAKGSHIPALLQIPQANIIGVVDVDRDAAEEAAGACEAAVYDNLEDCLGKVDAVYVLTPPSTHRELAVMAIRAGKSVLCEKPIAATVEDAQAMVQAAKEAKVKLMMAFNMRFRKGFARLKEAVDSGRLGEVVNFWSQRLGMGIGDDYNWRTDPDLMCGMSVESLSHDIDLMRWIAGDAADVRANVVESHRDLPGFDDNANVVITLANGGTALIHASWSSHLGRNSRGVIGTKGTAWVEGPDLWTLKTFRMKSEDMEEESIETLDEELDGSSYLKENEHFIDCIANDREPTVTGEDGLAALRVSRAILESHKTKTVVFLDTQAGSIFS